jgi:TetR/AcrR family transcriptional regulator, cholesterol catabolism regulator
MTAVMTMVTKGNRNRPRDEIRAALYETSIALFRAKGFTATSVDAITAEAGVAKGTFFNFFPAKIDVLKAYYGRIDAEIARLRAGLDPTDPVGALRRYGNDVEQILRREGPLMAELLSLTINDPAMRRIDEASGTIDTEEFAAFLAAAKECGALGARVNPSDAAAVLVDLWSGAMRQWLQATATSLADAFATRVAILFTGLKG